MYTVLCQGDNCELLCNCEGDCSMGEERLHYGVPTAWSTLVGNNAVLQPSSIPDLGGEGEFI